MTCSDSYPLSIVHILQKWIILDNQDKFTILCSVMLYHGAVTFLVRFGALCCILLHLICSAMTPT